MTFAAFDYPSLFAPGLPPPAARWSGRVKQWSVNREHSRSRLRLCFASASHEEIHEGIAALAEVCRRDSGVSG